MTVYVKAEGVDLRIPVPLATLPLLPKKKLLQMGLRDRRAAWQLYHALRWSRAHFPGLEMVHVWMANGDEVIVRL